MNRFAIVTSLTALRVPLVVLGAGCSLANLWLPHPGWVAGAAFLLSASALTDLVDGYLARRWNVTSRLGALLDPLMDKVFYTIALPVATFAAMFNEDGLHAAVLLALDIVSMLRDQWVTFLRSVGSEFQADLRANWSGKLRTIVGFPALVLIHIQLGLQTLKLQAPAYEGIVMAPALWILVLEVALILVTCLSAGSYTLRYLPFLRAAARKKSED
jgi:CDP-diacylglycerol--glycerol-3-phosphate 3-phosphatidyltransferase